MATEPQDTGLAPWDNDKALDYGKYAADKETVAERATPILHVVQANSPEASDFETAKPGDVVMRIGAKDNPDNPNIGSSFQAVVVARGIEYLWWGDRESGEGLLARMKQGGQIPEGRDAKDLLWPRDGGNVRADGKPGPVADLTRSFVVCLYRDGDVTDPALLAYARGGAKTGQQLNMALNRFKGPCYAAVLEFYTEKQKNSEGQIFFVLKAKPAGVIPPGSPLLEKLKGHHDALAPLFAVDDNGSAE